MVSKRQMEFNGTFFRCEKGTGTIIATVMVMIILMVFVGGTVIWQVKGQDEINTLEQQRLSERFLVEATFS